MRIFLVVLLLISSLGVSADQTNFVAIRFQYNEQQASLILDGEVAEVVVGTTSYRSELYRTANLAQELLNRTSTLPEGGEGRVFIDIGGNTINRTYNDKVESEFQNLVMEIFFRVTGLDQEEPMQAWPVDVNVAVMESYPEQYAVSALIHRNNDLLAVVINVSPQLLVLANDRVIYNQTTEVSINSGGQTVETTFPTFSVGENYGPDDLTFVVSVENYGVNDNWERIDTSTFKYNLQGETTNNELPFIAPFTTIIVFIVIKRRISFSMR